LRILVINWQDIQNPLAGGAEVHLHNVFGRLSDRGHEITLLVSNFEGGDECTTLDGMQVIRKGSRNTFNYVVPFAVRKLIGEQGYDLIVEDLNKLPFYTSLYTSLPVVGLVHHLFGGVIFQETNPLFGLYVYLFERSIPLLYRSIPFIAVSESTKEDLVRGGIPAGNVSVIYNGLSDMYRPSDRKTEKPTLLYLGRLKKYKRGELLLNCLPEIRERVPDVTLNVAGDGDGRQGLEQVASRLELEDCVNFLGFVSDEEKVRLLQESWALANTSPKEGWGLVSIEAQACGTPVVVYDAPGLRESLRDNESGFIVDYGDQAALTDRIVSVLEDASLRERLREGAIAWANQFTWDRAADETERVLKEVLH
jgi:glycosyltransferase involved in cell wall biosynthesis